MLRTAPGSAWLGDELERLHDKYDVRAIVCDDYGGNRAVARELEDAGLPVRTVPGGQHVGACGKLLDLVAERGFRHIGQPEFVAALRGAKSKPLGDAWVWSRKQSTGDAALVVAMTLALSAGSRSRRMPEISSSTEIGGAVIERSDRAERPLTERQAARWASITTN